MKPAAFNSKYQFGFVSGRQGETSGYLKTLNKPSLRNEDPMKEFFKELKIFRS